MMLPDLREASLLGSYANRLEYQVGRTLVWVKFDQPEQKEANLELAFEQFTSIWSAIPSAIVEACRYSCTELPEFWQIHEEAGTVKDVLSVWGIWIEPTSGTATYVVSTNYDFESPPGTGLPAFSDEGFIMVERSFEGIIRAKARDEST